MIKTVTNNSIKWNYNGNPSEGFGMPQAGVVDNQRYFFKSKRDRRYYFLGPYYLYTDGTFRTNNTKDEVLLTSIKQKKSIQFPAKIKKIYYSKDYIHIIKPQAIITEFTLADGSGGIGIALERSINSGASYGFSEFFHIPAIEWLIGIQPDLPISHPLQKTYQAFRNFHTEMRETDKNKEDRRTFSLLMIARYYTIPAFNPTSSSARLIVEFLGPRHSALLRKWCERIDK